VVPARAVLDVDLRDNDRAVLGKGFVPAGVVAMIVRVDEIFDRQVRDNSNGGLDLVMQRRELAVHHDDPFFRHRHGMLPPGFEHVAVVAEVAGLDLDLGKIRRRRCRGRRGLRQAGPDNAIMAATTAFSPGA